MTIHVLFGGGLQEDFRMIVAKHTVATLDKLKSKIEEKIEIPSNLYALYVKLNGLRKIHSNEEYKAYLYLASKVVLRIRCFIKGTSDQQAIEKSKQLGIAPELERFKITVVSNHGFQIDYDTTFYDLKLFLYNKWHLQPEAVVLLPMKMDDLIELKDEQFVLDLFFMNEYFNHISNLYILLKNDHDLVTVNDFPLKYIPNYRIVSKEENNEVALLSAYDDHLFTLTALKTKLQDILGIPAEQQIITDGELRINEAMLPVFFPGRPHETLTFKLIAMPSKEMEIVCKQHNIDMLEPFRIVLSSNHELLYHFTEESTFQDLCKFVADELTMPSSSLVFFVMAQLLDSSCNEHMISYYIKTNGQFWDDVPDAYLILRPSELSEQCMIQEVSMMKFIKVKLQNKELANLSAFEYENVRDVENYIEEKYRIPVDAQQISHRREMLTSSKKYLVSVAERFYDDEEGSVSEEIIFQLSIKYSLEYSDLLDDIRDKLGIEYLRYAQIQGLTRQIKIDVVKENVWNISDVKLFIEKHQRCFHLRQKLFFGKRMLEDHESLLTYYIEQEDTKSDKILLNFVLEPAAYRRVGITANIFGDFSGFGVNILETETIGLLKTQIEDLTEVKAKLIEIKKKDAENYPDDQLVWEVPIDQRVIVRKFVEVVISTKDIERTLRYEVTEPVRISLGWETVARMAKSLSRSDQPMSDEVSCQLDLDRKRTSSHIYRDTLLTDVNNDVIYLKAFTKKSCALL